MTELDDRTRRDLARLRDREAPSVAAKQRMVAAIEARIDPDPGGGNDPSGGADGGAGSGSDGGLAWAAKVVGATAGLTAGGLLALRVAVELVRALSAAPQASAGVQPSVDQPLERTAASAPVDVESDVELALAAPEPTQTIEAVLEPQSSPRRSSSATPSRAETRADNTLAAELALLEAAHAASDPAAALAVLDQHLASFPHGELADERELLRIESLCRLGRLTDARTQADRFLHERPNSALTQRLASTCPALAGSQKSERLGTDDTRAGHVEAR